MSEFDGEPLQTVKIEYDEDEKVEVKYEPFDSELEYNDVRDPVQSPRTTSSKTNSGNGIHESEILRYDNACLTCQNAIMKITGHVTSNLCPIVNDGMGGSGQPKPLDNIVDASSLIKNEPDSGQKQCEVLDFDTGLCRLECEFCEKRVQELKNPVKLNHPQLHCQPTYDLFDLGTDCNEPSTEKSTVLGPLKTIDFASAEAHRFRDFQQFRKPVDEKNTHGSKDAKIKKRTSQTSKRAGYPEEAIAIQPSSSRPVQKKPRPDSNRSDQNKTTVIKRRTRGSYGEDSDTENKSKQRESDERSSNEIQMEVESSESNPTSALTLGENVDSSDNLEINLTDRASHTGGKPDITQTGENFSMDRKSMEEGRSDSVEEGDSHLALACSSVNLELAKAKTRADSVVQPLILGGGHVDLTELERGTNFEEVNDEGNNALMEGSREGLIVVVQSLPRNGTKINSQTQTGQTHETITLEACGGLPDIPEIPCKSGIDIDLGSSTPLMEASRTGDLQDVKCLVESGVDIHRQTQSGDTASSYACENGHIDIAKLLDKIWADPMMAAPPPNDKVLAVNGPSDSAAMEDVDHDILSPDSTPDGTVTIDPPPKIVSPTEPNDAEPEAEPSTRRSKVVRDSEKAGPSSTAKKAIVKRKREETVIVSDVEPGPGRHSDALQKFANGPDDCTLGEVQAEYNTLRPYVQQFDRETFLDVVELVADNFTRFTDGIAFIKYVDTDLDDAIDKERLDDHAKLLNKKLSFQKENPFLKEQVPLANAVGPQEPDIIQKNLSPPSTERLKMAAPAKELPSTSKDLASPQKGRKRSKVVTEVAKGGSVEGEVPVTVPAAPELRRSSRNVTKKIITHQPKATRATRSRAPPKPMAAVPSTSTQERSMAIGLPIVKNINWTTKALPDVQLPTLDEETVVLKVDTEFKSSAIYAILAQFGTQGVVLVYTPYHYKALGTSNLLNRAGYKSAYLRKDPEITKVRYLKGRMTRVSYDVIVTSAPNVRAHLDFEKIAVVVLYDIPDKKRDLLEVCRGEERTLVLFDPTAGDDIKRSYVLYKWMLKAKLRRPKFFIKVVPTTEIDVEAEQMEPNDDVTHENPYWVWVGYDGKGKYYVESVDGLSANSNANVDPTVRISWGISYENYAQARKMKNFDTHLAANIKNGLVMVLFKSEKIGDTRQKLWRVEIVAPQFASRTKLRTQEEKGAIWLCMWCPLSLQNWDSAFGHVNTHLGLVGQTVDEAGNVTPLLEPRRTFVCDTCKVSYNLQSNLDTHKLKPCDAERALRKPARKIKAPPFPEKTVEENVWALGSFVSLIAAHFSNDMVFGPVGGVEKSIQRATKAVCRIMKNVEGNVVEEDDEDDDSQMGFEEDQEGVETNEMSVAD